VFLFIYFLISMLPHCNAVFFVWLAADALIFLKHILKNTKAVAHRAAALTNAAGSPAAAAAAVAITTPGAMAVAVAVAVAMRVAVAVAVGVAVKAVKPVRRPLDPSRTPALLDPALLLDRTRSFEVFRKSYRRNEAIEANKTTLKDKVRKPCLVLFTFFIFISRRHFC
jgi:hypothetical protein